MRILMLSVALVASVPAFCGSPECSGVDSWASNMAFVHLKNAGIVTNDAILWDQRKVVRIASEQIGTDLY